MKKDKSALREALSLRALALTVIGAEIIKMSLQSELLFITTVFVGTALYFLLGLAVEKTKG